MNNERICPLFTIANVIVDGGAKKCEGKRCMFCNPGSPYGAICVISGQQIPQEESEGGT